MEASQGNGDSHVLESDNLLHRRVKQRMAGHFLEALDPDGKKYDHTLRSNMDEETRAKFEQKFDKYKTKNTPYSIQNVFWIISSIAVFYYSEIYLAIQYDPRINRLWFNIGAGLISINICIAAFLIVWLTYIKKITTDEWERRFPAAIPVATGCFVIGAICLIVGLWPVWNILTPVILFFLFMGFVVTVAMIPNF